MARRPSKASSKMTYVKFEGVDEVRKILKEKGVKEGRSLMNSTLKVMAKAFYEAIHDRAQEGRLKETLMISQRRSKTPDDAQVAVRFGKISEIGKAWHWRFVEHGTGGETAQPARPFVGPAVAQVNANQLGPILEEEFKKKWAKAMKRHLKQVSKIPGE